MNPEPFLKTRPHLFAGGSPIGRGVRFSFLVLLSPLLLACQPKVNHEGRMPLAEVDGTFLYDEDVQRALPLNLPPEDSARLADDFIRSWAEEVLLYQQAERNVRSTARIEEMVQAYRRALITQDYQQQLIAQNLSDEISEDEERQFYEANKDLFVLKEPAIKGLFIKVPRTAPDLAELKKWYRNNDDATLEKIEKYCFRNAVIYEYFYDRWLLLSDLDGKLKVNIGDLKSNLQERKDFENSDNEFCYLLHIEAFEPEGSTQPFELAKTEIAEMLGNYRQVELIRQVKKDLYEHGVETGRVKLKNNKENEE